MGKNKIIGIIVAAVIVVGVGFGGYALSKYPGGDKKVTQDTVIQNNQATTVPTQTTQESSQKPADNNATAQKPTDNSATAQKPTNITTTNTTAQKPADKNDATAQKPADKNDTTAQKPADNNSATNNSQVNLPAGATINEIVPNGNIIYSAEKYAVPANEVQQMIEGKYPGNQKEVFLTFDDGPSDTNTPKILNILKQYGVHGTFFVLGSELNNETSKNILKEEIMDGNAIGNHSYSHNYSILYPHNSVDPTVFMNEVEKTNNIMQSVLGKNFNSRVVRMPGGYMSRVYYHDKNLPTLNADFKKDGITSIDWTAESGDAEPQNYSVSQLVQNAENQSKGWNHVVLLMHDIKPKTVQALPQIIEYYKSKGYEFKVISNTGIN